MKAKEAKETKIYFLERFNEVYRTHSYTFPNGKVANLSPSIESYDLRITNDNLYDFIMQSAEETTSPRGVENKLHIREKEQECSCWDEEKDTYDVKCKKCYKGTELVYQVWDWGFRGQYPKLIDTFDTESEADDFILNKTYQYDFCNDDRRNTIFFDTIEEAKENLIESYAEIWSVDKNVVISILSKMDKVEQLKFDREQEFKKKALEQKHVNNERVNRIALEYATLIQNIETEKYKETCTRLSEAIGERIESSVFHAAVKLIRSK